MATIVVLHVHIIPSRRIAWETADADALAAWEHDSYLQGITDQDTAVCWYVLGVAGRPDLPKSTVAVPRNETIHSQHPELFEGDKAGGIRAMQQRYARDYGVDFDLAASEQHCAICRSPYTPPVSMPALLVCSAHCLRQWEAMQTVP